MARLAAFHDTRNLYIEATGYKGPLTYDQWAEKPDDLKAALLFVQFYNEITLAWEKANTLDFIEAEEGVTTILQYLEKQVRQTVYYRKDDPTKKATAEFRRQHPDECVAVERRLIEQSPSKFSPGYIYTVAYNCLYCICHDRICDHERLENETSAIVMFDGQELNVFDTISDNNGSAIDVSESSSFESEFWSIIEQAGMPAEKVMRYLLSEDAADLKALSSRNKRYKGDPLRDIEVTLDAAEKLIAELREKFLDLPFDSPCGRYILNMMSTAV